VVVICYSAVFYGSTVNGSNVRLVIVKSAHVKEETDFVVSTVDAARIILILHDFIFVSILDFRFTIIIKF